MEEFRGHLTLFLILHVNAPVALNICTFFEVLASQIRRGCLIIERACLGQYRHGQALIEYHVVFRATRTLGRFRPYSFNYGT